MKAHLHNLELLLTWLKDSPFDGTVSSMQGGTVHVKFSVPMDREIEEEKEELKSGAYPENPIEDSEQGW
tara:strand:+ start:984 stop:1190 length:207 start_codon:yes stop_codon:yes gene_type:complete